MIFSSPTFLRGVFRLPPKTKNRNFIRNGRNMATELSGTVGSRGLYPHFEKRQTRLNDNDIFGHINNTVYYNFMDDAICVHMFSRGIGREFPRYVVENGIKFFSPISFPSPVDIGFRVTKLGSSSVTYDVGFFSGEDSPDVLRAQGKFVHVYIDEKTGRPHPIPDEARSILQELKIEQEK